MEQPRLTLAPLVWLRTRGEANSFPMILRLAPALILSLTLATPLAAAGWTLSAAGELAAAIDAVGAEGLDPQRYDSGRLWSAIGAGDLQAIEQMAPPTFRKLANDFAQGATPASQRIRWHLGPAAGPDLVERKMEEALGGAGVAATLSSLLPTHPQYAALKAALASTPAEDRARRAVLATNLDRWRWMPRAMGSHYLLVNVPGFELRQVEAGQVIATHRVIVGKPRTPTPQFAATVSGVILNPEWVIPASIQAEGIGRQVATNPSAARARGYVKTPTGITQLPGPNNALGQMKLRMPNPYTIYVHDTPAKALFARSVRAYSHGCIRTQNPFDLAERLLQGGTWDRARIDAAVAEGRTTIDIDVPRPIPIYVLYFTAWASDGGEVRIFDDIYGRDAPVKAALGWGEAKSAALASREAWESSCSQG